LAAFERDNKVPQQPESGKTSSSIGEDPVNTVAFMIINDIMQFLPTPYIFGTVALVR
jgi:hypothetical protein